MLQNSHDARASDIQAIQLPVSSKLAAAGLIGRYLRAEGLQRQLQDLFPEAYGQK